MLTNRKGSGLASRGGGLDREPTGEGDPHLDESALLNKDKMSDPGGERGHVGKRFTDDMKKTYESIWSEENRMWSLITCSPMFQVGLFTSSPYRHLCHPSKEIVGGA